MERQLKSFWVLPLTVLCLTTNSYAKNDNIWEDLVKRVFKKSKVIKLSAGRESKPLKLSPKIVSFKGVVEVPSQLYLINGSGLVNPSSGQIIVDGQIVCNYSPKSDSSLWNKIYYLQNCSDGTRSREEMRVNNKIELRLNYASSDKASLLANVRVISSEEVTYGLVFPYLTPSAGQILMYNGEAWVAADPSELDLEGVAGAQGPQGPQGEVGPMGPQGPAGADGAPGVAGAKGDKGDKGDAGAPGVAGAQGPQGPAGAAGAVGPQGPKGDAGPAGVAGATGAVGPQGPQGPAGADGAPGVAGPVGAQGPVGPQGLVGPRGADGVDGAQGAMGPQGPKGDQGVAGAQGPQGLQGEAGPQGPAGEKGEKGDKGDRGLSEIAYLRDERATGVAGGACNADGNFNQRVLNTLGGDTSFISLSNNRFVLQPGKYFVEVHAPALGVNAHQAKLRVVETNSDALIGSSAWAGATAGFSHSVISGEIIVSIASTFEVVHRCGTTKTLNGYGIQTGFGPSEIYTQVKIIKKQ